MGLFSRKKEGPSPEAVEYVKRFAREKNDEPSIVKSSEQLEDEKWERRRWELVRFLVAQDHKAVVLGKLNASEQAIARKARKLADATICDLRNNKMQGNGDETE